MAAADVPKWGFGQEPMEIKPVANFISFFSTCDTTLPTENKMSLDFSFSTPSLTRQPAWERVSTQSHPATGKNRRIMKRVGLPTERRVAAKQSPLFTPPVAVVPPPTREDIGFNQLAQRKFRRGPNFVPAIGFTDYSGMPGSHAECLNRMMQAKVDVANNFMVTSSCTTYHDKVAASRGIIQVTPRKRRADSDDVIETPVHMDRVTGNKLTSYQHLLPIIKKALRSGKQEIDLATASVAEFARFMRQVRRNPRKHLAAQGASDLSAIEDMSEPDSPTVIRQPNLKAESRSPQKRIARLMTNPFKRRTNRLAEGFVQLAPGPSNMLDSSPTKTGSAPSSPTSSSPLPHSTSPVLPIMAPAGIDSSPLSESAAATKGNAFNESVAFDSSPARPGRTFRVPSEFDSSSIAGSTRGPPETPTKSSSPVNYSRPIAPTPSQWNRAEPSTPFTPKPQSAAPTTPGMTSSPIGLSALLHPSTPKLPQCTYNTPSGVDSFDFGKESPFRSSSISWMNNSVQDSEPKRIKNVNNARRRQSEPLLRKYFDTQARRRSASPKKVQYQEEDTFRDDISIASFFDTPFATPAKTAASESTAIETTVAIENIVTETAVAENTITENATTENATTENATTENAITENTITENATTENATTENATTENAITENAIADTIPAEATVLETTVTENVVAETVPDEETVLETTVLETTVAENTVAENTVAENAVAENAAAENAVTEAAVTDTIPADDPVFETTVAEAAATETIPAKDTTLTIDAIADTQAIETAPAEITETSAIENGAHETSIDDNITMELEPEATPEVTDLADFTNADSAVNETAAAESSVDNNFITAVETSTTENAAQPDADEDMSDEISDISEVPTVIVRTPTDTDMNDTLPIPTDDENTELTTSEQGVVEIDMRENPDIFGTHVSSPPAPIRNLSRMADNACSGHAKVVVNEQNGRLFVRFKLSAEYAHIFPASQGFDESQLNLSPFAISHSPRISFDSNRIHHQTQPDMSSPAKAQDTPIATRLPSLSEMLKTPDISAFGRSPSYTSEFRTPELPAHDNTLMFGSPAGGLGLTPAFKPFTPNTRSITPQSRSIDSLLQTPDMSVFGITTKTPGDGFQTPELPPSDNTLMFGSANPMSTKRVTRRQSAMTPLKQALTNATGTHRPATPKEPPAFNYNTPKFATPMDDAADRTLAVSWSDVKDSSTHDDDQSTQIATPTKLTPTEVQPTTEESTTATSSTAEQPSIEQPTVETSPTTEQPAIDQTTTETSPTSNDQPIELSNAPEQPVSNVEVTPTQEAQAAPAADDSRQDYDSPGREYIHNFIKRSRQAATTTDAGSPIAPINQRQPLGARSPNRGSPMKTKRKHEEDIDTEIQSPPKKVKTEDVAKTETTKSAPKKGRMTKNSRQKSELEIDMTDLPTATPSTDKQVDELDAVTPATRRSSRIRVQETTSGAPKSSLPTPIKLNRAGAGRNGGANLTKKPRTEDQELDRKTRSNTKKNMGDAEFPSEVLVRLAGQAEEDSDVSQESEGSAGGRRVGWKTPLEKVQGETPKKGRAAPKGKGKATQGETGISKPKSTSKSTPKTARATKVAEGLGMVANGTPAKPQRVTRSRARSGV